MLFFRNHPLHYFFRTSLDLNEQDKLSEDQGPRISHLYFLSLVIRGTVLHLEIFTWELETELRSYAFKARALPTEPQSWYPALGICIFQKFHVLMQFLSPLCGNHRLRSWRLTQGGILGPGKVKERDQCLQQRAETDWQALPYKLEKR